MASPQRATDHGDHEGDLTFWLDVYKWQHPELPLRVAHNSTLYLDDLNEPQPDLSLRLLGGTSAIEDGYIAGPPELICEVAYSSVSRDLHSKKEAYRQNAVPEYIVWRVWDRAIDWFSLEAGQYVSLAPDAEGIMNSVIFPGLRLNVRAMVEGDLAAVMRTQAGI